MAGDSELIFVCLGSGLQCVLCGIEDEQLHVRGYLEVDPGDGHQFFINPENPTSGDHQIGDLPCLQIHHEIVDAAKSFVLRAANLGADQFVRAQRAIYACDRLAAAICSCRQPCTSAIGILSLCISAT